MGCSEPGLLTSDSDAGYVILEHYPEQRVFLDDRYDMYPTKLIYDYFNLADGKPGWSKILDRYHVETSCGRRTARSPPSSGLTQLAPRPPRPEPCAVWVRS